MTDLTPQAQFASVAALNNRGQVVGYWIHHSRHDGGSIDTVTAFSWERGEFTEIGSLGGYSTLPAAMNDKGQVVGYSATSTGEKHAFFWDRGVMTDLSSAGEWGRALGINQQGQVVGEAGAPGGDWVSVPFIWERGARTLLPIRAPAVRGSTSMAVAINNRGDILGSTFEPNDVRSAYLWKSGFWTDLLSAEETTNPPGPSVAPESFQSPMQGVAAPFPNPSRGAGAFSLWIERRDDVRMSLYDPAGRLVAARPAERLGTGAHTLQWNPNVERSGLYFVRVQIGDAAPTVYRWILVR